VNVRLETVSVIDREVELIREALAIAKRESEQLSLAVTSERQLIQVHEAGHAVIAFLLGHPAKIKLTVRNRRPSGVTTERGPRKDARARALVATGGIIAEVKHALSMGWPLAPVFEVDVARIRAAVVASGDVAAVFEHVTSVMIRPEVWAAVERLAAALDRVWPEGDGAAELRAEEVTAVVRAPNCALALGPA
jgi:hypothetical protein